MRSITIIFSLILLTACQTKETASPQIEEVVQKKVAFDRWEVDRFADKRVLRYQIPNFSKLSLDQKKLVYYLTQAGLAGRDIMYEMNYRHNLEIRKAIDRIVGNFQGDRENENWEYFMEYAKEVWFANGIHHHYGMSKFAPKFTEDYFDELLTSTTTMISDDAKRTIFDPDIDSKKVNLNPKDDLVLTSAVNFYGPDVTQEEVTQFYSKKSENDNSQPVSHGLNSRLVKDHTGRLTEEVYSTTGKYKEALLEVVKWLEKAVMVSENSRQAEALGLLIEYYNTGDLQKWDEYNVAWVKATRGDVDYIHGFVEVYNDPMGYKGSFESIIQIDDFEASERMKVLSDNAQWFEDHSPILPSHKKDKVVGISYKVVTVVGESGDASPATPIGVNLPNANWIRSTVGSKSVSLGNIIDAYDQASGAGLLEEFAHDQEEIMLAEKYGSLADKLSTALHEVIGHASGQLEPGIGTPKETLKNYSSTIEEARADIIALYFIMDQKMIDLGLLPSLDAAKAEYDGFISNGLLKQLRRLQIGESVEESHMRNRQLIASWAYQNGLDDNVIEKVARNGKTYYNITDYEALRTLFGTLLRELQRITSQGDYKAARELVESYGVKVDREVHSEVLDRVKSLNIPPYSGFINPVLVPTTNEDGEITDVKVLYPTDFVQQMLDYSKEYSFL